MPRNTYGDPHWQRGTAYYNSGKYLNADRIPYVVIPPLVRSAIEATVIGSECEVENLENKMVTDAVCGEIGPKDKLGEGSCELARRVGLNPSPLFGGTQKRIIKYTIYVGINAVVDGMAYKLQRSS
jgi:hypothetical protein